MSYFNESEKSLLHTINVILSHMCDVLQHMIMPTALQL